MTAETVIDVSRARVHASFPKSRRYDKSRGSQVPRLSCYMNVLGVVFKTNKFAVWPHVSLHQLLQPLRVLAAYGTFRVLSWQMLNLPKRSSLLQREARGSGAVGFAFRRFPWAMRHHCLFKIWSFLCATQLLFFCLARESRSLSFTAFAYCPLLDSVGLKNFCFLLVSNGEPLRSTSLDNLQIWAGAGTFKPSSPIHEASAKASAHLALIAKPTLAVCRDSCLPGVI
jgi:hypothetical protein